MKTDWKRKKKSENKLNGSRLEKQIKGKQCVLDKAQTESCFRLHFICKGETDALRGRSPTSASRISYFTAIQGKLVSLNGVMWLLRLKCNARVLSLISCCLEMSLRDQHPHSCLTPVRSRKTAAPRLSCFMCAGGSRERTAAQQYAGVNRSWIQTWWRPDSGGWGSGAVGPAERDTKTLCWLDSSFYFTFLAYMWHISFLLTSFCLFSCQRLCIKMDDMRAP